MGNENALMQLIMHRNNWSPDQMCHIINQYGHIWVQCVYMLKSNQKNLHNVAITFESFCGENAND